MRIRSHKALLTVVIVIGLGWSSRTAADVACPAPGERRCGSGTVERDGVCAALPECGLGTHSVDGSCVPLETVHTIVAESSTIPADSLLRIPMRTFATKRDGTASDEALSLEPTRIGAASLLPSALPAADRIQHFSLIPCDESAGAACLGPVAVLARRLSDRLPVAKGPVVTIVPRPRFGNAEACLSAPNVLYARSEREGVRSQSLLAIGHTKVEDLSSIFHFTLDDDQPGPYRPGIYLGTYETPLLVGDYDAVWREFTGSRLQAWGSSHCGMEGRFRVHVLERDALGLREIVVSFSAHCAADQRERETVDGCARVVRRDP